MTTNKSMTNYCNVRNQSCENVDRSIGECVEILTNGSWMLYTGASASWKGTTSFETAGHRISPSLLTNTIGIILVAMMISTMSIFLFGDFSSSNNNNRRRSWWRSLQSETKGQGDEKHDDKNFESCPRMKRKMDFLARKGNDYGYRGSELGYIDNWRPREFMSLQLPLGRSELDEEYGQDDNGEDHRTTEREVYLDYAGSALPMRSQLEKIYRETTKTILGNPHSTGPSASRTAERIRRAESLVLSHLGATRGRYASLQLPESFYGSSSESASELHGEKLDLHPGYDVLFTSGATEAFKTIAERFPWRSESSNTRHDAQRRRQHRQSIFLYATNSHNSVVGMRQLAIEKGAKFHCLDLEQLEKMTTTRDWKNLEDEILMTSSLRNDYDDNENTGVKFGYQHECTQGRRHLLVFPSECNFGGDRPDAKSIIEVARASGWYTMLDIAKHASTDRIHLNELNPDFAALSFYKLFGDPTGVGALLVRRSAIPVLFETDKHRRQYQGGGSVDVMLPNVDYTVPKNRSIGLASLSNGTSHFRGISNLTYGFDVLERLGGMSAIHRHTVCLARELVNLVRRMNHRNGMPVVRLYGAWSSEARVVGGSDKFHDQILNCGPTVAMNIFRSDGTAVGYNEVSKLAALNRPPIQFRTGCFCNPGACQRALNLDDQQAIHNYEKMGHVCGDHIDLSDGMPTGAIRVSFGKDSIWEDMDIFVRFIETTFKEGHDCDHNESNRDKTSLGIDKMGDSINDNKSTLVTKVSVSELYLFPIKSCAAQCVSRWPLCLPSGKLKYDREFAIVDTSGVALRMQTCSKLVHISPVIDLEAETMRVSAPGCEDLVIRLSDDLYHGGENGVLVCGNKCGGRVWGDAFVSEWFSSFLGVQCWLARYSPSNPDKNTRASTAASLSRPGFSNEQPILLVSENAVATLNKVLQDQRQIPCTAKRFRPNIVVKNYSSEPQNYSSQRRHLEDDWKTIHLRSGLLEFSVQGDCPRCTMVDYDPATGQKGKTLRALASYRRRNGKIVFGIFLRAMDTARHRMNKKMRQDQVVENNEQNLSQNENVWISEGDVLDCR